jgi:5-methylcytosine-specific restriction endonuclease McrA
MAKHSARKAGQGSKWLRPSTRMALYLRDGFCCAYCGRGSEDGAKLTADHVLAVDLGGTNAPTNLVTACLRCNSAKRNLSTRAWFARLTATGLDTTKIGRRVRRLCAKPLDRAAGRALAKARGLAE